MLSMLQNNWAPGKEFEEEIEKEKRYLRGLVDKKLVVKRGFRKDAIYESV